MSKAFVYDSIGLIDATIEDGTYNPGTGVFTPGAVITNEERFNDQSISFAVSGFDLNEMEEFDVESSKAADVIAVYFSADEADDLLLYATDVDDSPGTSPVVTTPLMTSLVAGWNVFTFTELTKRYWFLRASTGTIAGLCEIIIGKKYDFEQVFSSGGEEDDRPDGIRIEKSVGGIEYSRKLHDLKSEWVGSWQGLSASERTNLRNIKTALSGNFLKFLYCDGSAYHWVRMSPDSLRIRNDGGVYSTRIQMIKQLA